MFRTAFSTGLGAMVGAAGSILLTTYIRNLPAEAQLGTAAFLGAVCSSIFVCREQSIQNKLIRDIKVKKKGLLRTLRVVFFWIMLIGGMAAIVVAGLKIWENN